MIEAHWWTLVIGASLATAGWLLLPEFLNDPTGERSRIPPLTLTAAGLWATAATTASDLQRVTENGIVMNVDAGVWAYIALAGAAVSVLTFALFLFDAYPPTYHDAMAGEPDANPNPKYGDD